MSNWLGQTYTANPLAHSLEKQEKPWVGSGICMSCFNKKLEKEESEQKLIREAQLAQAREVLETPTVWECTFCKTVNRGNFCANCGSPRKKA
jgi:hypothetical protein